MNFSSVLPSRMIPYTNSHVRSLEMANFSIPQIKKLSKAIALDSIVPVIEAIGEVVNIDVDQLTDGDYHYLLAYQRIALYNNAPLAAKWTCSNVMLREQDGLNRLFTAQQIVELIETYESVSEEERANMQDPNKLLVHSETCGHVNDQPLVMDDITVLALTDAPLDSRLDYPRLATLPEAIIFKRDVDKIHLVDAARWIKEGDTLAEKFEVLENDPDAIGLLQAALTANITHAHGVHRHVSKKCTKCSAEQKSIFEVDASMFFRV